MSEEKGFTVRDRRRVKIDADSAETKQEADPGEAAESGGGGEGASSGDTGEAEDREEASRALPPVDFTGFVLGLAQMALVHLGEMPEPGSGETVVDLSQSRHTIDILKMLEEKTRGNLSEEESRLLQGLTRDLMLKYVHRAKQG